MFGASKIQAFNISGNGFLQTKNQRPTQVKNRDIFEDFSKKLEVVRRTTPTPGLPLITRVYADKSDALFDAIKEGVEAAPNAVKDRLMIKGLVKIPTATYLKVKP